MANKQYEKGLVIFIDILGSQSKKDFSTLFKISNLFHQSLIDNRKNDKENSVFYRTIHTFSDCAYIIYKFKEDTPASKQDWPRLFEIAMCNCEPLLLKFLAEGLVFRGGIAFGDVYCEKERGILFGPAVNAAYQLENKVAIYPRIVIEESVADSVVSYWNRIAEEMDNPKNEMEKSIYQVLGNAKLIQGCIVKQDFDGMYMLHYLNCIQQKIENNCGMLNEEIIKAVSKLCKEQIEDNSSNMHIKQKYEWLLGYVDSVTV